MSKKLTFNVLSGEFDIVDAGISGTASKFIPEYLNMDKPGAIAEDTWVRRTTGPTKIEWTYLGTTGEKLRIELI